MCANLVRAKVDDNAPLSGLDVDEMAGAPGPGTERDAMEKALLRQGMRVVYTTMDNVDAERDAGERAQAPGANIPGAEPKGA